MLRRGYVYAVTSVVASRQVAATANGTSSGRSRGSSGRILLVLAAVALAIGAFILFSGDEDSSTAGAPAVTPLPQCATLGPLSDGARQCRARSTVITEVTSRRLLDLEDVNVRIVEAVLVAGGGEISVRAAVTNRLAWPARFNERLRQAYIVIGERRIYARAPSGRSSFGPRSSEIQPGARRTGALRFPMSASARRTLTRRERAVDLGIIPFVEVGSSRPRSVGVVHLRVGEDDV